MKPLILTGSVENENRSAKHHAKSREKHQNSAKKHSKVEKEHSKVENAASKKWQISTQTFRCTQEVEAQSSETTWLSTKLLKFYGVFGEHSRS